MRLTEKFRAEHSAIARIAGNLHDLVIAQPGDPEACVATRRELGNSLLSHLGVEDLVFYPRLLASNDPIVAGMARSFVDEVGGLAEAFRAYVARWPVEAIEADWDGFSRETSQILAMLTDRIHRENTKLYPLAERLERR